MNELDEFAKLYGFYNMEELNKLVASVDISSKDKLAAFVKWQLEDGTKTGLLKLQGKAEQTCAQ